MNHFLFKNAGSSPFPLKVKKTNRSLLPTLCADCYRQFEDAIEKKVESGRNWVGCYCPHTSCLATADLTDNERIFVGVYGPINEAIATELIEELFIKQTEGIMQNVSKKAGDEVMRRFRDKFQGKA